MKNYIFTSESVTEGHPDKICDLVADSIVDAALAQDPYSNMARRPLASQNIIWRSKRQKES